VPPWFKGQPQLVLQIGLNMPVPIPDLRLDEDGMSCTLSFNRSPFHCVIPWGAVFAMVGDDGRGMVWPDDLPPEVARQAAAAARRTAAAAREGASASGDPSDADGIEPAAAPEGDASAGAAERARPASGGDEKKRPGKKSRLSRPSTPGAPGPLEERAATRLVAVPNAPPSEPRTPRVRPAAVATEREDASARGATASAPGAPPPAPSTPTPPASPAASASATPRLRPTPAPGTRSRTKRELPPYLRVVK